MNMGEDRPTGLLQNERSYSAIWNQPYKETLDYIRDTTSLKIRLEVVRYTEEGVWPVIGFRIKRLVEAALIEESRTG